MPVKNVLKSLFLNSRGDDGSMSLYSPITNRAPSDSANDTDTERASHSDFSEIENDQLNLHAAQRHATPKSSAPFFVMPSLTRFLADFTLGFADGLTVPFALTAGLSSLGQTETVIYAGMAEICAGSISMGIGGYLSARGENAAASRTRDQEEEDSSAEDPEKTGLVASEKNSVVQEYLAPLDLPEELSNLVTEHLYRNPGVVQTLAERAQDDEEELASPILVGLSVALGYLLGGILPLAPYLFVSQVGTGLLWSFIVCIVALFVFGFTKDFLVNRERRNEEVVWSGRKRSFPWKDIRRSTWEGTQMVLLGSVAAASAVLCVRLFEGLHE